MSISSNLTSALHRTGIYRLFVVALSAIIISIVGCAGDNIVAPDAAQVESPDAAHGATAKSGAVTGTSLVYSFPGGPGQVLIEGASGNITRTANGVNYRIATNSLIPGHAYTLWVVIFNEPVNCPTAPVSCMPEDLFNESARPDMLYGAGLVVGGSGKATFAGRTRVGDVSGSVQAPAGMYSNGLTNPYGAEIHFVVHDHGPVIPAFMPDMIQSLAGGCTDSGIPAQGAPSPWNAFASSPQYALEYGRLGPNECKSVQYTIL